jgi:hypothetical protein
MLLNQVCTHEFMREELDAILSEVCTPVQANIPLLSDVSVVLLTSTLAGVEEAVVVFITRGRWILINELYWQSKGKAYNL